MNEILKELFEACRNGDLTKVKKLITSDNINAQDILGRKSTPLHFSSGTTNFSPNKFLNSFF
jgi:tankyrase